MTPTFEELYWVLAEIQDPEEMRHFLVDLCSRLELEQLENRWIVARLLDQKRRQADIQDRMQGLGRRVASATISRVNAALEFSRSARGEGGYNIAFGLAEQRVKTDRVRR